jgi:hypothetical protein
MPPPLSSRAGMQISKEDTDAINEATSHNLTTKPAEKKPL